MPIYVVTMDGAAKMLEVSRERIRQLINTPDRYFPEPDFLIDGKQRAWSSSLVDWVAKFRTAQGRWPRADERPTPTEDLEGTVIRALAEDVATDQAEHA